MPPGSAKSTYASVLFPPHYLANKPKQRILACSHNKDLIAGFGRDCRNLIELREKELGYSLDPTTSAADDWATSHGSSYICAGVGAGIAGRRADLGIIDDFVGTEEDAKSQTYNQKVIRWYWADFWPRLKPNAAQIIICNHRYHDDLPAHLIARYPGMWTVLKFPFIAEDDNDILGRKPGDRLWPDYFTESMANIILGHPEFSGLYQQRPTPESGDFFKAEWIDNNLYDPVNLPAGLQFYATSDHAVRTNETNDLTCLMPFGVDHESNIYILPDIFWTRSDTGRTVDEMLAIMQRRKPLMWGAGKDHISGSIGPFLTKLQRERSIYCYVEEMPSHNRNKRQLAASIQGRMKLGMVKFPKTSWLPQARREMLEFDKGVHDDFVDALGLVGMLLDKIGTGKKPSISVPDPSWTMKNLTYNWLQQQHTRRERKQHALLADN